MAMTDADCIKVEGSALQQLSAFTIALERADFACETVTLTSWDHPTWGEAVVLATAKLRWMDLKVWTSNTEAPEMVEEFVSDLAARIAEARRTELEFAGRLRQASRTLADGIEEAGAGMGLGAVSMWPIPVKWPFKWRNTEIVAEVEMIDHNLVWGMKELRGVGPNEFRKNLKTLAKFHREMLVHAAVKAKPLEGLLADR